MFFVLVEEAPGLAHRLRLRGRRPDGTHVRRTRRTLLYMTVTFTHQYNFLLVDVHQRLFATNIRSYNIDLKK